METFIVLGNYTRQGMDKIKESPDRLASAKRAFRQVGAELKQFFLVTGQYDMIVVVEAPDAAAMAKIALAIGAQGNVKTETLRAFTEAEYQDIVAGLP